MHYRRWRVHGDPLAPRRSRPVGKAEAFRRQAILASTDACIPWPYHRGKKGYAELGGKRVHRLNCIEAHGEPPTAKSQATHECGNRACINPRHLSWCTNRENRLDAARHLRLAKKLSVAEVLDIRASLGRERNSDAAKRYGLAGKTVRQTQDRNIWAWLRPARPAEHVT